MTARITETFINSLGEMLYNFTVADPATTAGKTSKMPTDR